MRSLTFCRLSLLYGLMLGTSLLWTVAGSGAANAASAPASAVEESEPDVTFDILEFRIAPKIAASPRKPNALTPEEIADYRRGLADNGPSAPGQSDDRFIWMRVRSGVKLSDELITEQYRRANYLLVHNQPPLAVWPEDSGFWYIDERATGARGRPYVGFQYDGAGPDPLHYLTSTNMGETLAAIVEGKVVSAPTISTPVGSQAIMSGAFARGRNDEMLKVLRDDVLPAARAAYAARVASAAEASAPPPRSLRTYIVPILIFVLAVSIIGFLIYR